MSAIDKMGVTDNVVAVLGKATHKDWSRRKTERVNMRDSVRAKIGGCLRGFKPPTEKLGLRPKLAVVHIRHGENSADDG